MGRPSPGRKPMIASAHPLRRVVRPWPNVALPRFVELSTRTSRYRRWTTSMRRVGAQPNIRCGRVQFVANPPPTPRRAAHHRRRPRRHRRGDRARRGGHRRHGAPPRRPAPRAADPRPARPALGVGGRARPRDRAGCWDIVRIGDVCHDGPTYRTRTRTIWRILPCPGPCAYRHLGRWPPGDRGLPARRRECGEEPSATRGYKLDPGDLLFARSGATVGNDIPSPPAGAGPCAYAGYLIRFRALPW